MSLMKKALHLLEHGEITERYLAAVFVIKSRVYTENEIKSFATKYRISENKLTKLIDSIEVHASTKEA